MAKQEYEIIWKKGNIFEKGRYVLQPKTDYTPFLIIYYVLVVALILLLVITISFWSALIGLFFIVREKRYLAGICSLLALIYFYIDIEKEWLTSIFKYADGPQVFKYVFYANNIGAGLGVAFIVDAILISFYGKRSESEITLSQMVIYLFFFIVAFFIARTIG